MSYKVFSIPPFDTQLKRLAKKYPSLKNDYANLLSALQQDPAQSVPLGKNCYKIRMKITSKKTGKSGGARVITYVKIHFRRITLLEIYDKAERDNISEKELAALLKKAE